MAALVWAAMDQFGISRREMGELFLGTVVVVALIIGAAGLVAALWMGLRRLRSRSGE
jgi:hypothetical protein